MTIFQVIFLFNSASEDELSKYSANDTEESALSYTPDGIDSDDDEGGCCHWSKHVQAIVNDIEQDGRIVEYKMSKLNFEDGTKPHSIIKTIMEDAFIEACIDATNEHVYLIQNMRKRLGRFQKM